MNDSTEANKPNQVGCEVCLKEIPESVATTEEGEDYIHYFCGLDCYTKWKKQYKSPSTTD